mmetsp:Transcript_10698/g.31659  ORF Transcript_10698/g.31659 Transcript_10698/m.31659 type:complete len:266 (+) Transcript_10698:1129-1926(+)
MSVGARTRRWRKERVGDVHRVIVGRGRQAVVGISHSRRRRAIGTRNRLRRAVAVRSVRAQAVAVVLWRRRTTKVRRGRAVGTRQRPPVWRRAGRRTPPRRIRGTSRPRVGRVLGEGPAHHVRRSVGAVRRRRTMRSARGHAHARGAAHPAAPVAVVPRRRSRRSAGSRSQSRRTAVTGRRGGRISRGTLVVAWGRSPARGVGRVHRQTPARRALRRRTTGGTPRSVVAVRRRRRTTAATRGRTRSGGTHGGCRRRRAWRRAVPRR